MLRQIRKESGLKVQKIADLINVSRMQYYNYENGKCKIPQDKLVTLAKIFKVPIRELKK